MTKQPTGTSVTPVTTPLYVLRRNEIVLVCKTEQDSACARAIMLSDKNGSRESPWWGHPTMTGMLDGTAMLRVPANSHNILLMYDYGARANMKDQLTRNRIARFQVKPISLETNLPLRPFQHEGAEWLLGRNINGCLSFTVGLGKTLTTLAALRSDPDTHFPAVVLAPAHVKLNWVESEWVKWGGGPDEAVCLFGRTPNPAMLVGRKLIVLNHHILAGWVSALIDICPKVVLIDEAHMFVGHRTKTYPYVERLCRAADGRVTLITATPLVNNLGDIWSLANLVNPDILGTKTVFEDTFMPEERVRKQVLSARWRSKDTTQTSWAKVARAKLPRTLLRTRTEQLKSILFRSVMLRRTKEQVQDQLPAVTETHLRIDVPTNTKEGKKFWEVNVECANIIAAAKEDPLASAQGLMAFGAAKRAAVEAKLPDAEEWIRSFLLGSDEKLVVVGWSVEPLEELHKAFRKESVLINGKLSAQEKHKRANSFETVPTRRVLFGNIKSIGTGIDLVAASTMLFIELPMTAVDLNQAKGRIDRLSQKSTSLSYYYMTVRDSLEEKKGWALIRNKDQLAKQLGM